MNKKAIIILALVMVTVPGGIYAGLRIWFKSEINKICSTALSRYPGDRTETLIAVLHASDENLTAKNSAIWALGKLNDKRALPVLRSLQTGTACDHERYVCQQQLDIAIKTLEGKRIDILKFR